MERIPKHRKQLGEAVRQARKKAKLTQEQLGEKAELHPNYVGEVERGEKAITIDSLINIARVVKVPLSKLLVDL